MELDKVDAAEFEFKSERLACRELRDAVPKYGGQLCSSLLFDNTPLLCPSLTIMHPFPIYRATV